VGGEEKELNSGYILKQRPSKDWIFETRYGG
jgi:hypothetical protein